MVIAFVTLAICAVALLPAVLIRVFLCGKEEKLLDKARHLWSLYVERKEAKGENDLVAKALFKKHKRAQAYTVIYHNWIGFGFGRKLIYSVINIASQVLAFCAIVVVTATLIKLPFDRAAYSRWDRKVDYYNNLEEPKIEDIEKAKRLNTFNYGEDAFLFLSPEEEKHVKEYMVDTDEMMRKFYRRVGITENND